MCFTGKKTAFADNTTFMTNIYICIQIMIIVHVLDQMFPVIMSLEICL